MKEQRDRARADARAKRTGSADVGAYRELLAEHGPTDWRAYDDPAHRLPRARAGRRPGRRRRPAAAARRARSPASSSTGRRSTPSPAARSPTPASSPGTAAAPRCSTCSARSRAWSPTRCGCSRASCAQGAELAAEVDREWRLSACQAHSGTHVVHAALRQVLGPQALQSGSYNRPGYLRLDFAWQGALTAQQRTRHRGRRQRRRPRRPPGHRAVHDAARGAGVRRAGAVRRDLRRAGPRRGDRRPVVARALRWHARARQRADRHAGADRRVVGRLRRRAASRRSSGSRASATWPASATWSASSPTCSRRRRTGSSSGSAACSPGCATSTRSSPSCASQQTARRGGSRSPPARTDVGGVAVVTGSPAGLGGGELRTLALDVRGRLPATGRSWCCWRRNPVARWHSWPR